MAIDVVKGGVSCLHYLPLPLLISIDREPSSVAERHPDSIINLALLKPCLDVELGALNSCLDRRATSISSTQNTLRRQRAHLECPRQKNRRGINYPTNLKNKASSRIT